MNLHAYGEDYLAAVLTLHKRKGTVRSIDLTRRLEVSKSSVSPRWRSWRLAVFAAGWCWLSVSHPDRSGDGGRDAGQTPLFTSRLTAPVSSPPYRRAGHLPDRARIINESFQKFKNFYEKGQ